MVVRIGVGICGLVVVQKDSRSTEISTTCMSRGDEKCRCPDPQMKNFHDGETLEFRTALRSSRLHSTQQSAILRNLYPTI